MDKIKKRRGFGLIMNEKERISRIQGARTPQQLDQALAGFHEQVIATNPSLQVNYAFNLALQRKQYFHALCDIKRASRGVWGGGYHDIIGVLERAAEKQCSFVDKSAVESSDAAN
jgi:hypothetical protein